ncbi:ankyrin repeat domain-containing protein [bacterium]|nr:ankyrin repeat domain-containing protein [bacterium]MBU1883063.1 ankyrin repeat domain-containing protein [bacterium]
MRVIVSILLLALTLLGATSLNRAILDVNEEKIYELLHECKNINLQDHNGNTPLHAAARVGRVTIVKAVLKCKPDADIKNKRGNTALSIAIAKNHMLSVTLILDYKKETAKQKKQKSVINDMIKKDDIAAFKILIRRGADVNAKDKNGVTLLHVAAKYRAKKIVKYLLENGADVKIHDNEYRDTLYYARFGRDTEIINMIRKKIDGQK